MQDLARASSWGRRIGSWSRTRSTCTRKASPSATSSRADGQEIKVGDLAVKIVTTPGHTPGTLSMMFQVKDNGKPLTVAYSGGTAFNFVNDVPHFDIYIGSQRKMAAAAASADATVLMSNHSEFDNAVNKIKMMRRAQGRRAASVRSRQGRGGALFQGDG